MSDRPGQRHSRFIRRPLWAPREVRNQFGLLRVCYRGRLLCSMMSLPSSSTKHTLKYLDGTKKSTHEPLRRLLS